jgi:putative nucleotidyltransferase with HDIG domain
MAAAVTRLSPETERKLGTAVERMPAFPRSVQKILELSRNIDCLPKDLVGVIEKDPVMTMKVLKVINSAYYSLPYKITSVAQSVVYLGLNTVKNLALSFAAIGILPRLNAAGFDIQRYLLHSLTTAAIARQLCTRYAKGEADPADCYVAGLLHDFGKVVFAQFLAPEFRQALALSAERRQPLYLAEREVFGADHGLVGALLAERWQFPETLVACIREHHRAEAAPSAMLDCLRTADQISRLKSLGDAGNPWWADEPPAAPERFGADWEPIIAALGDLDKIVADAMLFAETSR